MGEAVVFQFVKKPIKLRVRGLTNGFTSGDRQVIVLAFLPARFIRERDTRCDFWRPRELVGAIGRRLRSSFARFFRLAMIIPPSLLCTALILSRSLQAPAARLQFQVWSGAQNRGPSCAGAVFQPTYSARFCSSASFSVLGAAGSCRTVAF